MLLFVCTFRFVWEKDGQVIIPQSLPRMRLDVNGTLHISQTWSGDIGTYTCRVTSVGGNDSRSAHLRVRSEMKTLSHHPTQSFISSDHSFLICSLSCSLNRTSFSFSISLFITCTHSVSIFGVVASIF